MKKFLSLALVSVILGAGVVRADTFVANTAKNQRGLEVNPEYGGFDATRIAWSGAETMICTGHCVLRALILGTGAAGQEVYVFDTAVANGANIGGTYMKLKARFYSDTQPARSDLIPVGLRFNNGISIRLSSVANGEQVTVGTVDLDQR